MNFDEAFRRVIGHEGGFGDNPKDRGNWSGGQVGVGRLAGTKFGISAAAYPHLDIRNITLDEAKTIYLRDYWGPAGCDLVPHTLKFDLFDTAVNGGVKRAITLLQKAAGSDPDGILGPRTVQAVQSMDPFRLLARFNGHRLDFLNDNPAQWIEFGRGWAQRIAENLMNA